MSADFQLHVTRELYLYLAIHIYGRYFCELSAILCKFKTLISRALPSETGLLSNLSH